MIPTGRARWISVDIARDDFVEIGNRSSAGFQHARVNLYTTLAARLHEFGEEVPPRVFEAVVHLLMSQRCILVILVMRPDPYEGKLASGVIGQRHAMLR